jgi:hypothetical protein
MNGRERKAVLCACLRMFDTVRGWRRHRRGCEAYRQARQLAGRPMRDMEAWRERRAEYERMKAGARSAR